MVRFEDSYGTAVAAVCTAIAALPTIDVIRQLTDKEYLAAQASVAGARKALDSHAALLAGEGAWRSRPELGYRGLAAREGFKNPVALVQATTGLSAHDTKTLVKVGSLVQDATADPITGEISPQWPWLASVASAVASGELSPQQADAIRTGLGSPINEEGRVVTEADLAAAAEALVASKANPDTLHRLAREMRDDLDIAGVVEREKAIHLERSFKRVIKANGMPRYIIDPDIETAAFFDDLVTKVMSPRRNGPRFIDPGDKAWADSVSTDTRTPEQYLHDVFAGLIKAAATSIDNTKIVGSRQPSVRVLTTKKTLESGDGVGHIEGNDLPVSSETVERIACAEGTIEIEFDKTGQVINLGREQRLFTAAQKAALAARDGGCVLCGAPPAMTEAHHIDPFAEGGKTDIADGVLLCRFCHMMLHNNGWRITRDDDGYWLVPPKDVDAEQTPRKINAASPALRDLRRESDNTFSPAPEESATPADAPIDVDLPAPPERSAATEPSLTADPQPPPPDEWEKSA